MGRPLVVPESLIALIVRLPVILHERQSLGLAGISEERGDVGVCARLVAVLAVGAVAVVGPQAVDAPRIGKASDGVSVPKLDLLDETAGGVDAAGVGGRA